MKMLTRPYLHLLFILFCVFLVGCALKISDSNMTVKTSPNFNVSEGHFENTDGTANEKSLTDLAGLARAYFSRPDDPNEVSGFQVLNPNNQPESARQVIWIGQSTLLVSIDGMHILTDPVFSDRASPFSFAGPKRVVPPALSAEQMPKLAAILISHNHYDHLDLPSLTELADRQPETLFLVPLGLKSLLNNNGIINVVELDWWQEARIGGITFTATPVRHWSSRSQFDRNKTLWAGWMVRWPDYSFYFAGDSGYTEDFAITKQKLGAPDLAALPIGAYAPRNFMKDSHMTPEEAVQALEDMDAGQAVAVHWGTFKLTIEPLAEPPKRLQAELERRGLAADRFLALTHGQKLPL